MEGLLRKTAVAVCILALLTGIWLDRPAEAAKPPTAVTESEQWLGIWEGRLALYSSSEPDPLEVYDIWLASLPPQEQQRLAAGITVPDEKTLTALLTDYGS